MKLTQTSIPDVVIIEPTVYEDERGWFMESFNEKNFHQQLIALDLPVPAPFVQDNHSCSHKHVLRGLHYQEAPYAQGKLVRVTQGAAFDVAVDIRPESESFGRYVSLELSASNCRILWIPEGFAHGFLALTDNTHFLYKTTNYYSKTHERSVLWCDPEININWPAGSYLINEKDCSAPALDKNK